jgi:hypothetical protein
MLTFQPNACVEKPYLFDATVHGTQRLLSIRVATHLELLNKNGKEKVCSLECMEEGREDGLCEV